MKNLFIGRRNVMIVHSSKLAQVKLTENGVFNHLASNFLAGNRDKLIKYANTCGVRSKADDLIQDVYLSLLNSENKGESYDMNYKADVLITLEEFVYKRLKMYAKNEKYHDDKVEAWKAYTKSYDVVEDVQLDIDGTVIKRERPKKVEVSREVRYSVFAATPEGTSDLDKMNDMQVAYAMAVDLDSQEQLEAVEEVMSIKGEIEKCIDICEIHGYDIITTFKNIDKLADLIGNNFKKAGEVFRELKSLVSDNDELAESVMNVLKFSMGNKEIFDRVLSRY